MKPLAGWTFLAVAAIRVVSPAWAQDASEAHRADILRLMELTQAVEMGEEMGNAMAEQMIGMLQAGQPDLPPRVFEIIREESIAFMSTAFRGPDGMLDELVEVYAAHLSPEDTRRTVEFYETPTGSRVAAAIPQIQRESMRIGEEWGERMGPELGTAIAERLQEEGLVP